MSEETMRLWMQDNNHSFFEDLKALTSIPSISANSCAPDDVNYRHGQEALACAKDLLLKHEITHDILVERNYLLAKIKGQGQARKNLGIFAHLDVVPTGDRAQWISDPFDLREDGDFLVGRGVADNKGSILSTVYALKYLKEKHVQLNYDILLFMGINEENGMACLDNFLKNHPAPDIAYTPDANFPVCVGEKSMVDFSLEYDLSDSRLLTLRSGVVSNSVPDQAEAEIRLSEGQKQNLQRDGLAQGITLEFTDTGCLVNASGKAAHAAFPEGSTNALVALAEFLLARDLYDKKSEPLLRGIVHLFKDYYGVGFGIANEDPVFKHLTIVAGCSKTSQPIYYQYLDCRMPPALDMDSIVNAVSNKASTYGFTTKVLNKSKGYLRDQDSPWIQLMWSIFQKYYPSAGLNNPFYVMGGGTYARKLPNAVGFGPGNPNLVFPPHLNGGHKANEAITKEELQNAFYIYVDYLKNLNFLDN